MHPDGGLDRAHWAAWGVHCTRELAPSLRLADEKLYIDCDAHDGDQLVPERSARIRAHGGGAREWHD